MSDKEALELFRKIVDETGVVLGICPNTVVKSSGESQVWDIVDLSSPDLYGDDEEKYLISSDQDLRFAVEKAAQSLEVAYLLENQNVG